jgi:hypothetical protein
MTLSLLTLMATTTAGIGAPQFDDGGAFVLKMANVIILGLAIVVLWKNAFGAKRPHETMLGPSPLSVKAHEELVTRREFAEIKARTIAVENQLKEVKDAMHSSELRLIEAGHEREEKLMARIYLLVPEVVRALDRTEQSRRGGRA